MSRKLSKYIVTTGHFDDETNNLNVARKNLKRHALKMRELYGENDSYGLYKLIEKIDAPQRKK